MSTLDKIRWCFVGMWIKINSGWEHIIFDYVWHWNLFECVWPNKAAGWPFALLYQVRLFVQQSGKMYCQDVHWINVFRLHPSVGLNGSITDHRQVLDNAYKCWGDHSLHLCQQYCCSMYRCKGPLYCEMMFKYIWNIENLEQHTRHFNRWRTLIIFKLKGKYKLDRDIGNSKLAANITCCIVAHYK